MEKVNNTLKKNIISIMKLAFIGLIVLFVIISITKEIKSVNLAETLLLIRNFSNFSILFLIILGILAVSSITLYDFLIVKYLKLDIKPLVIFNISYLASTINNVSGLGGLTGASIRSMLFKKNTNSKDEIIDYNLLLIPSTAIGLPIMALISLIKYENFSNVFDQYKILILALIGFFIYLVIYPFIDKIFYNRINKVKIEINHRVRYILKFKLLIVSTIEWLLAYSLFLYILKNFNSDINIFTVFSVFTLGSIAGIVSMLPGGVGSFDIVILAGLQGSGLSTEHILASLILYRVFYYIIPLLIGVVLTLVIQTQSEDSSIKILKFEKIQGIITYTTGITNLLLSILVFLSGIILLTSALIPSLTDNLKLATKLLSFPILHLSRQLSISVGILLLVISKDIRMKVKRAYKSTWWLLAFGVIFTFTKGFDFEEAIFLIFVMILLRLSKESFYRKSLPFDPFSRIIISVIGLVGIIIYTKLSHIILLDFFKAENIKNIIIKGFVNYKTNGIIPYISLILFLVIWELTKQRIDKDDRYEKLNEEKLADYLQDNQGSYLTHLAYLGDKHIFFSSDDVVFLYEKAYKTIVILGDPIGDYEKFSTAIDEFHNFIDEYGYKSVFYEVSENLLSLYHEQGYYFFKLGETALVDLKTFNISHPSSRDFRNKLSRFKRDGYTFQMLEKNSVDEEFYSQLKEISDEWLDNRSEMGFSLGFINKEYINKSKIGIIKNNETGLIIAFASLIPKYDNENSISIDLMRFRKEVPSNTMEFLILNLILTLQTLNYKTLNLGMAPLSNVGENKNAHIKERIAHIIFTNIKSIYNFNGLRKYKEKFNPQWEGRYLAYEDITSLPTSLIESALLIHSKNKRN